MWIIRTANNRHIQVPDFSGIHTKARFLAYGSLPNLAFLSKDFLSLLCHSLSALFSHDLALGLCLFLSSLLYSLILFLSLSFVLCLFCVSYCFCRLLRQLCLWCLVLSPLFVHLLCTRSLLQLSFSFFSFPLSLLASCPKGCRGLLLL